jgi:hypothetical protein
MRKTKGRQKVVWAANIEKSPSGSFIPEKKMSIDIPTMTSGKTRGKNVMV